MSGEATAMGAVEVVGTALGLFGGLTLDAATLAALTGLGAGANAFIGVGGSESGFTTLASYNQAINNGANTNTSGGNSALQQQQIYNNTYNQAINSGMSPQQAQSAAQYASNSGVDMTGGYNTAAQATTAGAAPAAAAPTAGTGLGASAAAPVEGGTMGAVSSSGVTGGAGGSIGGLSPITAQTLSGTALGAGVGLGAGALLAGGGATGAGTSGAQSPTPGSSAPSTGAATGAAGGSTLGSTLGDTGKVLSGVAGLTGVIGGLTGGLNTTAPNPGDVAGTILQDELNFAPSVLNATQTNMPQYASLQSGLLAGSASSILSSYGATAPGLQSLQTGLNSQQAAGNQSLLQNYGAGTLAAYQAANPQLQQTQTSLTNLANGGINQPGTTGVQQAQNSTLAQYAQTAQQQLAMGTSISPQEQATVANQVLSNYNSMGRANDPMAIAGLATGLDTYGQQLLQQREAASSNAAGLVTQQNTSNQAAQATNLQGQLSALGGAGSLALNSAQGAYNSLLSPSQGLTQAYNTTGQAGTSLQNASALAGMYNPFNSAAYGPAYNASTQANQINANTNAGLVSGGLGLLGSALGSSSSLTSLLSGFCWIAREVYGIEDTRWVRVRRWMFQKAPMELVRLYWEYGEGIAERLRSEPEMKARFRGHFDTILEEAYGN